MKFNARTAFVAALFVCVATAPAVADEKSDLQTKVAGAMRNAKSYVQTTLLPAQGFSSTTIFVAPDRTKTDVAIAANTIDVVTVGDTSYTSRNGAPFEKGTVPPEIAAQVKNVANVRVVAIVPDVTTGGTTMGAFQTMFPAGPEPITLTCTYDKKTYRLAKCANDQVTQTFGGYDDPKNAIDIPKDVQ